MDNLVTEISRLVAPILLILPALYMFFLYQRRRDRDRFEMEHMWKREDLDRQEHLNHRKSREINKEERYSPRLQEEVVYRLDRLENLLTSKKSEPQNTELSARIDYILDEISQSKNEPTDASAQLI